MTEPVSAEFRVVDKTIIVTGANSGIGKETAVSLAEAGARVVMLCRNADRGNDALAEVRKRSGGSVELILADLAEPDSIDGFAQQFRAGHDKLDILVNNAGVYLEKRRTNSRGWEMHWAVNHLGPARLTMLLGDMLVDSPSARIVNVSSFAHRWGVVNLEDPFCERRRYTALRVYADTKLANILWTATLNARFEGSGVRAYALHPGMIATNLTNENPGLFALSAKLTRPVLLTAEQGARTSIWLATARDIPPSKGHYYAGSKPRTPAGSARKRDKIDALCDWTLNLLDLEE